MPADDAAPLLIRAARPEDVPLLLELLRELAEYERLAEHVEATEDLFHEALFSERPAAQALIAERGGEAIGYALFFPTFSTFLAIQGVWLEDLYVRPAHRKSGAGRALLAAVAAHARERGAERLEWSALKWNELALGFYRGLGAQRMDEWVTHRLVGEELRALAGESSAAVDPQRR
ncbi:MAG TPA: GNAT family N-acetyltransferase [Solirubrobacteraceae bacterium]|jgi:GNAT superfamily N-acetyltransferase|nr:GNAT family N-acetyltransferase [Solirubrobacteraceae bacterium]